MTRSDSRISCRIHRFRAVFFSFAYLAILSVFSGCNVIVPQPQDEYVNGRVRITYWEKWTGFEGQTIRNVVDRFNEIQDHCYVHLVTMSEIDRKALVSIAGGNPPDLVGLWSAGLPAFAEKHALMPLTPFMEEAGMRQEDFIDVFLDLNRYEGELYGLPTTPATVALHWNKKLFREAGLDPDQPPRTLAELDEMAQKLTKFDKNGYITQLGFTPGEPGWWPWAWGNWFGGKLWDGKNITYDSPENVASLRWAQTYPQRYGKEKLRRFQSGTTGNYSSPQNAFFCGKVAMVLQGVWLANFIAQYAPELEWGAAAFPSAVPGLENVAFAECDSICIPVGARHPKEAFEFMRYLSSQEGSEMLNLAQQKFTPLKQVSPDFIKNHPNPYIQLFIDLASSPNVFHTPTMSIWFEYLDEIQPAFDSVLLVESTPEQTAAMVQERASEIWERAHGNMEHRKAAEQRDEP